MIIIDSNLLNVFAYIAAALAVLGFLFMIVGLCSENEVVGNIGIIAMIIGVCWLLASIAIICTAPEEPQTVCCQCETVNEAQADVCDYCGNPLVSDDKDTNVNIVITTDDEQNASAPTTDIPSTPTPESVSRYCTNCGTPAVGNYCGSCGTATH